MSVYIYIYADVCITGGEEGTCTSFPDMPYPTWKSNRRRLSSSPYSSSRST